MNDQESQKLKNCLLAAEARRHLLADKADNGGASGGAGPSDTGAKSDKTQNKAWIYACLNPSYTETHPVRDFKKTSPEEKKKPLDVYYDVRQAAGKVAADHARR